jgi:hypothetical protein
MPSETRVINRWLVAQLRADPQLQALVGDRIYYSGVAEQNATFPYVRYHVADAADIRALPMLRPAVRARYYVGAVTQLPGAADALDDILSAIDGALTVALVPFMNYLITCERSDVLRPAPYAVGNLYIAELGALFDVIAQRTA